MMDSYAEQIVKKADNGSDSVKRTACFIGGIAAGLLLIALFMKLRLAIVGAMLGVGAFYGGLYLGTNYDVEYEYLVVNNELSIDKILAKKRRKKLINVNVSGFEDFGKYDDNMTENDDVTIIYAAGVSEFDEALGTYYADFNDETHGKCRLVFTPSVKVLRELKLGLKGTLKSKVGELPADEQ